MLWCCVFVLFFFFKQKTAYEMRISDWSSDVCSSDLIEDAAVASGLIHEAVAFGIPDARLGAAIVLIVRGEGAAADEQALAAHLRRSLPNFMQPHRIAWRDA